MLRLLEGRTDGVGEGSEGGRVGATVFETLNELIEVGNLTGIVDAAALIVEAGEKGNRELPPLPACQGRQRDGVIAGVIEKIVGRAIIAALGIHTMQAQSPLSVAGLQTAAATAAAGVGVIA